MRYFIKIMMTKRQIFMNYELKDYPIGVSDKSDTLKFSRSFKDEINKFNFNRYRLIIITKILEMINF